MNAAYVLTMLEAYVFTIAVETLVLLVGLARRHPLWERLFAGVWLTACTLPLLWLVLPAVLPLENRRVFLAVGETLVPLAECALFYLAFQRGRGLTRRERWQDWVVIVLANLASFGLGEVVRWP